MPEKLDINRSYGQKLISLFAKLLFSGESYSLSELAGTFGCSKQTILRLIDDIRKSYGVEVEESMQGNRKYYRIRKPGSRPPAVNMTEMELNLLYLCRAFAECLLGQPLFEEAARALDKSKALLPAERSLASGHFASFRPGSIDYTPHHEAIRSLIEAMEKKTICRVSYRSIMAETSKTFYLKPLKLFSHRDTIYLHARLAREPGRRYRKPDFDPLLAVHRFERVEITDRLFEFPQDYNFDEVFNRDFGIMKEETFQVEVEFCRYAARYIAERIWSPDQQIIQLGDGKIKLSFSASSELEVIAWLLSFGAEARVLEPEWLVERMREAAGSLQQVYL